MPTLAHPHADNAVGTVLRRVQVGKYLILTLQLILVVFLIGEFHLESRTFFYVAELVLFGFIVHSLLPLSFRLPFFVALSMTAIVVALDLRDGAILIGVGIGLIAICHLPVRFGIRIGLLVVVAALLAVSRAGWLPAPWSAAVWPILGSMFMFRLALYLHALRRAETPPSSGRALAYFFMLPNVCFPLFPVVDYTTFARTYYDSEPYGTYQRGVQWIVRGLVHLLLYRLVYLHWTTDPAQLATLGDLVQHLLSTFLLYLRVSGQFHLVVGVLHLFGFRLPETNRLYYLASSFTDFWRRINIYWKDFMMKLFYYPSFFWLRRWGGTTALVCSTFIVFLVTWILHSYQWFWLRGGFPLTAQDGLFWGVLAVLVVITTLREARRGPRKVLDSQHAWSSARAVRTVLTFSTICVLWSLWSAESVGEWLAMWSVATRVEADDLLLIGGILLGGLAVGGHVWDRPVLERERRRRFYQQPAVQSLATLIGLLILGQPARYERWEPEVAAMVASLQRSTLNARDAELQHTGYYEKLDNVSRMSAQLWDLQAQRPADWAAFKKTDVSRRRTDFLLEDIQPSMQTALWGQPFSSNHWGMRDREYTLEKPAGTVRIAILGPSFVMGLGVADGEPFDEVLEERLNRETTGDPIVKYEVLNFGVGAYSLLQQLAMLEDRALAFRPDIVMVALPEDKRVEGSVVSHLTLVTTEGVPIPYDELSTILREAGVDPVAAGRMSTTVRGFLSRVGKRLDLGAENVEGDVEKRLRSASDEIIDWSLRRIADLSRAQGAVPIAVGLDIVRGRPPDGISALQAAEQAGFIVLNLYDVYDEGDPQALRIAPWDEHPNASGHRLIAERLYVELRSLEDRLHLGLSPEEAMINQTGTERSQVPSNLMAVQDRDQGGDGPTRAVAP